MSTLIELQAKLAKLEAENAKLKSNQGRPLSIGMSDKGCISVYGLNTKFPTSLYKEQWLKLLAAEAEIRAFIAENEAQLDRLSQATLAAKQAERQAAKPTVLRRVVG